MITHLISTTELVKILNKDDNSAVEYNWLVINNYANFISQKPELWMFVPCDEEGNVLEEPELPYDKPTWCDKCEELNPQYGKLYKAQSKVLFKGWKYDKENNYLINKDRDIISLLLSKLEGYTDYDLELTETALKQLNLI